MLVNLININKFYNGKQILKNINLCIDERDRIGLIGINGCGKTTLLRILTGKELPDRSTEKDGIVSMASKTSIGYLEQMSGLDGKSAVIEEMKDVFSHLDSVLERMKQLELQMKTMSLFPRTFQRNIQSLRHIMRLTTVIPQRLKSKPFSTEWDFQKAITTVK